MKIKNVVIHIVSSIPPYVVEVEFNKNVHTFEALTKYELFAEIEVTLNTSVAHWERIEKYLHAKLKG